MGVESVSVARTLSHAITFEDYCHPHTRLLLPALGSMKGKIHTIADVKAVYKMSKVQNLNYCMGKTSRTQIWKWIIAFINLSFVLHLSILLPRRRL